VETPIVVVMEPLAALRWALRSVVVLWGVRAEVAASVAAAEALIARDRPHALILSLAPAVGRGRRTSAACRRGAPRRRCRRLSRATGSARSGSAPPSVLALPLIRPGFRYLASRIAALAVAHQERHA
jgi:hypothetical protein